MYRAGSFYFPTGGGSFSVVTGFQPQGIMFFGTNIAPEDTMIATSFPGIFFGMVWLDYLTGVPDAQCCANSMLHGINVKPDPIVMPDSTGCNADFHAQLGSLDAEGFTLNVVTPAPGSRLVHYLAWGDFDGAGGTHQGGGLATYPVPYRPTTGIGFNYRTSGGLRDGCEDGPYNSFYVGGSNWPDEEQPPNHSNRTWGTAGFSRVITIGATGFVTSQANVNPQNAFKNAINFTTGDGISALAEERGYMWRNANEDIETDIGGGPIKFYGQWWTGEGFAEHINLADSVAGESVFGAPFDIEAAWFAGAIGSNQSGLSTSSRMFLGVLTEEYQGCVAASREGGGWAFQSKELCLVEAFDEDTGGILAGSARLAGDTIVSTTEIATSPGTNPTPVAFTYGDVELPQFFRVLHK